MKGLMKKFPHMNCEQPKRVLATLIIPLFLTGLSSMPAWSEDDHGHDHEHEKSEKHAPHYEEGNHDEYEDHDGHDHDHEHEASEQHAPHHKGEA